MSFYLIGLLILLQKYDKILRLQNKKKGKMYCKKQKVGKSQKIKVNGQNIEDG